MGASSGAAGEPSAAAAAGRIVVNGDPIGWRDGMTVRDALRAKNYVFPLVIVTVDGTLVPRGSYDSTPVPSGADVKVVHLISGG